ncbi:MAG: SdiA-regulated domain-containing protein [Bacteroidia bacterium]
MAIKFLPLYFLLLFSCNQNNIENEAETSSEEISDTVPDFNYQLNKEDTKYDPGEELVEISGLEYLNDSVHLCIQDEEGIVFFFNLRTENVVRKLRFHGQGDFEGVARAGNDLWVLKSDVTLYRIINFTEENPRVEKHTTRLGEDQDAEGLCYDEKHHRLLIACKDDAGINNKNKKAVYAFDLNKKEILEQPVILIDSEEMREHVLDNALDEVSLAVREAITLSGSKSFIRPSAIAIHPADGSVFILSSRFSILIVLNADYTVRHVLSVENDHFLQPEGITFSSGGDLYISNEGNNLTPNILKFSQRDK